MTEKKSSNQSPPEAESQPQDVEVTYKAFKKSEYLEIGQKRHGAAEKETARGAGEHKTRDHRGDKTAQGHRLTPKQKRLLIVAGVVAAGMMILGIIFRYFL